MKEIPPRVEYHLTEKGQEFGDVIAAIEQFAQKNLFGLVEPVTTAQKRYGFLDCSSGWSFILHMISHFRRVSRHPASDKQIHRSGACMRCNPCRPAFFSGSQIYYTTPVPRWRVGQKIELA